MSETTSGNPTLYFLVGGLLVAVLAIGYFTIGRDGSDGPSGSPAVSVNVPDDDTGSSFELNVDKNGGVSGSIEKE